MRLHHILVFLFLIIFFLNSYGFCSILEIVAKNDAFIDSRDPNKNYGKDPYAYVDNDAKQRSLYSWDISNFSQYKIKRALLKLYIISREKSGYTYILLFYLNNNWNWSEDTIVWNNQPSIGFEINYICIKEPLDQNNLPQCFVPAGIEEGTEYILDITEYVNSEISSNNRTIITFFLGQGIYGGNYYTIWATKDHPNPNYHPKLVLEIEDNLTTTTITTTTTTITTTTISTTIPITSTTTTSTTTSTTIITTTSTTIPQTTTTTIVATTSTTTSIPIIQNFRKPIIMVKN
ncbi:MAG: DNRLRE domain-containing protein, partial [Candidatus Aenigmatarchaeota archaeon]